MEAVAGQKTCNLLLGVGHPALILGFLLEGGIGQADARIDDGNTHALAFVSQVPRAVCAHGGTGRLHKGL